MPKNSAITNFFKPVPRSLQPAASSQQLPETPAISRDSPPPQPLSSLPSGLLSSSPSSPKKPSRDRDAVIKGSDDEDEVLSSDDDFPELPGLPLWPSKCVPAKESSNNPNSFSTPRAKRRAVEIYSSPLTINTKSKPKYDLAALRKHEEAERALQESEKRSNALEALGSPSTRFAAKLKQQSSSIHDSLLDVLPDAEGSQDESKVRLLQAVARTEATVLPKQWFFFDESSQTSTIPLESRSLFPKGMAKGVWAFLATEGRRNEVFEDGLPLRVQRKMQNLPDEIFQWVLQEVFHEKSKKLRDEYLRLLGACPSQIRRLMDEDKITWLFQNVGASERALVVGSQPAGGSDLPTSRAPCPEQQRDLLGVVLRILKETAHSLAFKSLTRAMTLLLRLGMDHLVREDAGIATDHQNALSGIALGVHSSDWNNFCGNVSDSLYHHTPEATFRWNAVSSIPPLHPRLVELRRRLALVFVFDDPQRAYRRPEDTFSMRSVIDRLEHGDGFVIDRSSTDFLELFALTQLLAVAIGDGSPPPGIPQSEAVKQFDAEVDEVAYRIRHIFSMIPEQGAAYMSRTEARGLLKDLEHKLLFAVRTRSPPKTDAFGLNQPSDGVELAKQQEYMKNFLTRNQHSSQ